MDTMNPTPRQWGKLISDLENAKAEAEACPWPSPDLPAGERKAKYEIFAAAKTLVIEVRQRLTNAIVNAPRGANGNTFVTESYSVATRKTTKSLTISSRVRATVVFSEMVRRTRVFSAEQAEATYQERRAEGRRAEVAYQERRTQLGEFIRQSGCRHPSAIGGGWRFDDGQEGGRFYRDNVTVSANGAMCVAWGADWRTLTGSEDLESDWDRTLYGARY